MRTLGNIGQDVLTLWVANPTAAVDYMIGQVP